MTATASSLIFNRGPHRIVLRIARASFALLLASYFVPALMQEAFAQVPQIQGRTLGTEIAFEKVVAQNKKRSSIQWHRSGVVPEGPHAGEAILTEVLRSAVILNGTTLEKQFTLAPGEMLVGNIFHKQEHWVGKVSADAVQSVSFVIEYFSPNKTIGHGMLRFKFNRPVQLVAKIHDEGQQVSVEKLAKPITLNDVFLSNGPVYTKNSPEFSFKLGMENRFAGANRLLSAQDRALTYYQSGHPQQEWPLNYNEQESSLAFKETLVTSHVLGYSRMFHSLWRNCVRCSLDITDRAIGYTNRGKNIFSQALYSIAWLNSKLVPAEVMTGPALLARGMRELKFNEKDLYLETDPTLQQTYAEVRTDVIQDLAGQELTQEKLTKLNKKFGPEFIAELNRERELRLHLKKINQCDQFFNGTRIAN